MATFTRRDNGQWQAKVRKTGYKPVSKVFTLKAEAEAWASDVERQMHQKAYQDTRPSERILFESLADWYEKTIVPSRRGGATDKFRIATLKAFLSGRTVASIGAQDGVDFVTSRLDRGKAPATVRREFHQLSDIIASGMAFKVVTLHMNPCHDAVVQVKKLRLLPKSTERDRRLVDDELDRLLNGPVANISELGDLIEFAIEAPMRQAEIAKMRIERIDWKACIYKIPETKTDHITGLKGRDMPLRPEAIKILRRAIKRRYGDVTPLSGQIWFYRNANSVSCAFRYLCKMANIDDLHYHDLRHEGTSRLFEAGYAIERVALFTGHRDWRSLKKYTHINAAKMMAEAKQGAA